MIIELETTFITLTTTFKYDSSLTTKDVSTLQTDVLNDVIEYSSDSLEDFTGMFRYSEVLKTIDDDDASIYYQILQKLESINL